MHLDVSVNLKKQIKHLLHHLLPLHHHQLRSHFHSKPLLIPWPLLLKDKINPMPMPIKILRYKIDVTFDHLLLQSSPIRLEGVSRQHQLESNVKGWKVRVGIGKRIGGSGGIICLLLANANIYRRIYTLELFITRPIHSIPSPFYQPAPHCTLPILTTTTSHSPFSLPLDLIEHLFTPMIQLSSLLVFWTKEKAIHTLVHWLQLPLRCLLLRHPPHHHMVVPLLAIPIVVVIRVEVVREQ